MREAYGVQPYEIAGPAWLVDVNYAETDWFELAATMPEGTTKEQFAIMLQNALADRFGLKVHREKREVPGYALTVAKRGAKLERPAESAAQRTRKVHAPRRANANSELITMYHHGNHR